MSVNLGIIRGSSVLIPTGYLGICAMESYLSYLRSQSESLGWDWDSVEPSETNMVSVFQQMALLCGTTWHYLGHAQNDVVSDKVAAKEFPSIVHHDCRIFIVPEDNIVTQQTVERYKWASDLRPAAAS